MKFENLQSEVIAWANQRDLIKPENCTKQLLKTVEEVGELCSATLKNDQEATIDAVGDVLVTLIIFCEQKGLNPVMCLASAYEEIKNRKGKTLNGTFIKEV
jgi:NTP pyrophosphatase (non-canonical NTP hydrolase)